MKPFSSSTLTAPTMNGEVRVKNHICFAKGIFVSIGDGSRGQLGIIRNVDTLEMRPAPLGGNRRRKGSSTGTLGKKELGITKTATSAPRSRNAHVCDK